MKCPGPVGIVDAIGETYQESRPDGWFYVAMNLLMMAILQSVNLGVMNLLPIPALDGGRLVFLIIEAIRGKGTSDGEREHGTFPWFCISHGIDGADSF